MKVVMVFGAFDGLHPGHLDFFRQAKEHGDSLVVSVGRDRNVEKIKHKKTLFSEAERLDIVGELKIVDNAVLGAEEDFFEHIKQHAPDVICLGYDQWASDVMVRKELDRVGLTKTDVVRLKPFDPLRAKSTVMKEKSGEFTGFAVKK